MPRFAVYRHRYLTTSFCPWFSSEFSPARELGQQKGTCAHYFPKFSETLKTNRGDARFMCVFVFSLVIAWPRVVPQALLRVSGLQSCL